ncbi:MAG: cupredoxin domain-containing protein [Syntrophaceae bacterium]|nr:cupredoxin domain-containing protein [Syntrophaceae bacterium]
MKLLYVVFILATVILLSCAPRFSLLGPVYLVYPENRFIDIELRSYTFQPNHFVILQNQSSITLRLTNTFKIKHNFTLIDWQKKILVNVDLRPMESTTLTIESLEPGNYIFYCNRFLHRLGGMEGMLMVD